MERNLLDGNSVTFFFAVKSTLVTNKRAYYNEKAFEYIQYDKSFFSCY